MGFLAKTRTILVMIKFEHSVFALPFAYLGMLLAEGGIPDAATIVWVTLAMVGARSFAMALNRLLDVNIDRRNPRTASRALPQRRISITEVIVFLAASLLVFFLAVFMLPSLCHRLWPVVLVPMALYSLTKHVTWLCHFVLGLCLALAPAGAWVATVNALPPPGIWLLALGVMLWTAGFDIIYSCQDYSFDCSEGLHSVPVRFGIAPALRAVKILHALSVSIFCAVGAVLGLGLVYYLGMVATGVFLWYENSIISADNLERIESSFFTMNGFVSITIFVCAFASMYSPF
jgi:4-hydroxybenzoate polyprenyltransferase